MNINKHLVLGKIYVMSHNYYWWHSKPFVLLTYQVVSPLPTYRNISLKVLFGTQVQDIILFYEHIKYLGRLG